MGTFKIALFSTLSLYFASFNLSAEEANAARFATGNTQNFIEPKLNNLAIIKREFDPFGRPQDPSKKVIIAQKPTQKSFTTKEQKILIKQEINKLGKKINILGRNLLIEGRSYKRKDTINVKVKGKTFPLRINSITRKRITFLDLTDKELISLELDNGRIIQRGEDPSLNNGADVIHDIEQ